MFKEQLRFFSGHEGYSLLQVLKSNYGFPAIRFISKSMSDSNKRSLYYTDYRL